MIALQTTVSFRLVGGHHPVILVQAYVNDAGPYEFLLDTGAAISLVSSQLAAYLGIGTSGPINVRVAGGPLRIEASRVDSLAIGAARAESVLVAIMDLSDVGEEVGATVDGDIGYSYLKYFQLVLDYRRQTLTLLRSEETEGHEAELPPLRAKFTLGGQAKSLILIPVLVNGQGPYPFALDTGASITVLAPELASELHLELAPSEAMVTGGGYTAETMSGHLESLAVGTAELRDVPVAVSTVVGSISQAMRTKVDGIIGYNYLKEFIVTIDYPNQTLGLALNEDPQAQEKM